jgi:hypothetical protein
MSAKENTLETRANVRAFIAFAFCVLSLGFPFASNPIAFAFANTNANANANANQLDQDQCLLFHNGVQDLKPQKGPVSRPVSVLLSCQKEGEQKIATRRFTKAGESFLLLVDSKSITTRIEKEKCWKCHPTQLSDIAESRFGSAVERLAEAYKVDPKKPHALIAAGLKENENPEFKGTVVTADLCPSIKSLDQRFFDELRTLQREAPVALAISGWWLKKHQSEFDWLKEQASEERLNITWVNHTYHHPFTPGAPIDDNFLLKAGVKLDVEILETERLLIENGVTPSVFFRFPGLVSNPALMKSLRKHMLIPLAADSWLAVGQMPKEHSIILVHGNGNEPLGIQRFTNLIKKKQLALPLLPVQLAPKIPDENR